MQDARYLRSQARIYFELAQHMSRAADADVFRVLADDYLARAIKIETGPDETPVQS